MRLTHDATHDTAYLELVAVPAGGVAATKTLADWLAADFDATGQLVGLEVLDASAHLPPAALAQADSAAEWLTLPEAGRLIGRSPITLRVQIGKGRLPARKQGRDWLVSRAAAESYAMALEQAPAPTPAAKGSPKPAAKAAGRRPKARAAA